MERFVDAPVTYTLEYEGQIYIIEHIPARIPGETGGQYFAPDTVEHVRALIKSKRKPDRLVETPVYEYA